MVKRSLSHPFLWSFFRIHISFLPAVSTLDLPPPPLPFTTPLYLTLYSPFILPPPPPISSFSSSATSRRAAPRFAPYFPPSSLPLYLHPPYHFPCPCWSPHHNDNGSVSRCLSRDVTRSYVRACHFLLTFSPYLYRLMLSCVFSQASTAGQM